MSLARGHEAVIVSHQAPIWMLRLAIEGRRFVHDPRKRQCTLASLTSLTYRGDEPRVARLQRARGRAASHGPLRSRCMTPRPPLYAVSRRRMMALASVSALLALGACSSDPNSIAEQAKKGDQKGYIAGNGAIEQIPSDKRLDPITLEGETLDGRQWSSTRERGKQVVVVNLWGSWCPPCIEEIPDLEKVWTDVQAAGKPVQFMGIDFREDPQRGQAFVRTQKMTYPSLSDESGVLILAFGRQAPTSPPSTIVLDKEGRVAARANGAVSAATLQGLIDDVLES